MFGPPRGPAPNMECHNQQLNESELLLAVLLPVCMVALIIVAVAIYCIVMSPSLCPGRRDHALSVEAAVAEALAKDRRARERKKAHAHSNVNVNSSKKHNHNATQQRRISARRAIRHSRSSEDAGSGNASNAVLSNTAHAKFIGDSVGRGARKRADADYDGAPVASSGSSSDAGRPVEAAANSVGGAERAPHKGAIAYDVVHTADPHDGDSPSASQSDA